MRFRHFLSGQFHHPRGEVLSIDSAAVFVQLCSQDACAKPDIEHCGLRLLHNDPIDGSQHFPVTRKRIGVFLIGNSDCPVISICPQVKAFIVQHAYLRKSRFVEQTAQQKYTIFPGPFPSCALIASNNMDATW